MAIRILIHYGEIALKGKNRPQFQKVLQRNIKHKLDSLGLNWIPGRTHDRLHVDVPTNFENLEELSRALSEIAGIVWLAPARCLNKTQAGSAGLSPDFESIKDQAVALAAEWFTPDSTFAVRVNRADKRFPLSSEKAEHWLGRTIIENTRWRRVDLENPRRTFHLDIYPEALYLYVDKIRGVGGLPVGTTGRVLSLLSGGLDSPVASYLAAKRGCQVDFLHFAATIIQPDQAERCKPAKIVRDLSRFTLRSRLYLAPYVHFELAMIKQKTRYQLIAFRRFMAAVAEALATKLGAQALITGDSLGQVASQTLANIVSEDKAVQVPILRPLITYDKQEIVALAKKIGTYEASIQPYKDCCAIISHNTKTRSSHQKLARLERQMLPRQEEMIEATLADALTLEYDCGRRVA